MSTDIVIIFGAGSRFGPVLAYKYLNNGYKVVTVSRSFELDTVEGSNDSYYHFAGDLADLNTVGEVFKKTRELFGEPRVLVYNAVATLWSNGDEMAIESVDTDTFVEHLNVNTTSVFLALKEAIRSFSKVDTSKPKTFIFTGNIQNIESYTQAFTTGIGKSATYSLLVQADKIYNETHGFSFFYADQRHENGGPSFKGYIDPDASSDFYYELSERRHPEIPVEATFVPVKGYTKF